MKQKETHSKLRTRWLILGTLLLDDSPRFKQVTILDVGRRRSLAQSDDAQPIRYDNNKISQTQSWSPPTGISMTEDADLQLMYRFGRFTSQEPRPRGP